MALPSFTPVTALIGGLTLGVATVAKYCITGRILGVSGTIKGLLAGETQPWRVAFTLGLLLAGALARAVMPGAFEQLPDAYTVGRGRWRAAAWAAWAASTWRASELKLLKTGKLTLLSETRILRRSRQGTVMPHSVTVVMIGP